MFFHSKIDNYRILQSKIKLSQKQRKQKLGSFVWSRVNITPEIFSLFNQLLNNKILLNPIGPTSAVKVQAMEFIESNSCTFGRWWGFDNFTLFVGFLH